MTTHKERIFAAARGEMPDILPYVPRIDLWYNANAMFGKLPSRHRGRTQDEISRAEGWALHHLVPEFLNVRRPEDNLHRGLGLYSLKEMVFRVEFPRDVEIEVKRWGDYTKVRYHTPLGTVSTTTMYSEEMRRSGASITWIEEHVLKKPEDYRVVAYIFDNLNLVPDPKDFEAWVRAIGDDGIPATMVGLASSPMHHIQKEFLDATSFYYHYNDHRNEMTALSESVENFFEQALRIIADSPAEAVLWGANFDDMITYPAHFETEIQPWIRKASEVLGGRGKICICHCDGENHGLMDLIRDSGMHVAEAICPHPMTRVKIEEYYQRWSDKLTIFGGIPSNMLLAQSASDEDFEAYLDHLFEVVAPGNRMILGIADTTPPGAVFERLVRIGERVEKEGRLPLQGAARFLTADQLGQPETRVKEAPAADQVFAAVQEDVRKGDHLGIKKNVQSLLDQGISAKDILQKGMIAVMTVIGQKFKAGKVFIPEVLLSARAMNEALLVLEPHLAGTDKVGGGRVLIGTVRGDLHDIGKNMVSTMLRGVGFEIKDIGINVPVEEFIRRVSEYKPDIVGMSALLTTTMEEMHKVIGALKAEGLRHQVKVIVGGAPVNAKFAAEIGADGYAADAGEAVDVCKRLVAEKYR